MIQIAIPSLDKIEDAAHELKFRLGRQKKIAFSGLMGAGKTTFIQALCKALGFEGVVNSPTFALINEYNTSEGDSIFHFDLYRIENITELYDLGYEDYFYSDSYVFIEWPEKAMELIPDDFLFLRIEVLANNSRLLTEIQNEKIS